MVAFAPAGWYTGKQRNKRRANVMSFASGLYGARRKSGLSQEAVAEKLGVSRQTISKWETGGSLR